MGKLDDLCAIKVMNWKRISEPAAWLPRLGNDEYWEGQAGEGRKRIEHWNPSTSLDDALVCLERARNGHSLDMRYVTEAYARQWHSDKRWIVAIKTRGHPRAEAKEVTLPLAMCLCSLRAMGVPESEIQEAMK